jgi:hypothetical protein
MGTKNVGKIRISTTEARIKSPSFSETAKWVVLKSNLV